MLRATSFFTGRNWDSSAGVAVYCVRRRPKEGAWLGFFSSKGRRRPYFVSSLRGGGSGQGWKRAPDPSECTQFMAGMVSSFLSSLGTPMPPRITRDERRSSRLIGQKMEQARENYARPEIAHARSGGGNYLYRLLLIPSVSCCISFFFKKALSIQYSTLRFEE